MKDFVEYLTPEQKESFKNWYVYKDYEIRKMVDNESDQLTPENFRLVIINEKEIEVVTVDGIEFCNPQIEDFDFGIGYDGDYVERDAVPKEVVEFLDEVLNKAQYEE